MKNFFIALCFLWALQAFPASAETMRSIPNPLRSNRSWISDNAQVIDAAHETLINRAIENFQKQTSGEIVVVTVRDTDGETPKEFATELFNLWKIGKRGQDNGVLILLVMQNRRIAVETGYGSEGALPDGKAMALVREKAVPRFGQGDFGGGLLALIREYILVLGGTLPLENNPSGAATSPLSDGAPIATPLANPTPLYQPYNSPDNSPYNRQSRRQPEKSSPFDIVLGLFMLAMFPIGLGALGWGGFAILKQLASRKCSQCGREMRRLDEKSEDVFLSSHQQFEERLGGLDYKVWQCDGCGVCHIERSVRWASNVKECPRCRHYTLKVASETVRQPTYHRSGLRETTQRCEFLHCGHRERTTETLPRLENNVVIVSGGDWHGGSSSGSSWGGGSSSSSSGSDFSSSSSDFGGGSSGGGGGETGW